MPVGIGLVVLTGSHRLAEGPLSVQGALSGAAKASPGTRTSAKMSRKRFMVNPRKGGLPLSARTVRGLRGPATHPSALWAPVQPVLHQAHHQRDRHQDQDG